MAVIVALIALVGLMCAIDLLLTVGVIRRLREHSALLARTAKVSPAIAVGQQIGAFATITIDDESLTQDELGGDTLVGFFSPGCAPCHERLPGFMEYARAMPRGKNHSLAVIVGNAEDASEMVAQLRIASRVVVEGHEGSVNTAFGVESFPTVLIARRNSDRQLVVGADEVRLLGEV